MNEPIVSIIMATYNRGHLIEETLDSIMNQTFTDWECFIVDDGSLDNTQEVVQQYILKDYRFKYWRRSQDYKKGLPGARNYGLDLTKSEYIVFFDDDDIAHPELLSICIKEIRKYNNPDFCRYLRSTFTNRFNNSYDLGQTYDITTFGINQLEEMITNQIPFNSCQVLWKKASLKNMRYNESLMFSEEWEFYSRLLLTGMNGISIEKVLYFGRKHANSNTGEFQRKDKGRLHSKVEAAKQVLENLARARKLSKKLEKHFIRLAFSLKSYNLLLKTLEVSDMKSSVILKYKIGFWCYPVLRPLFRLKARINSA